VTRPSGQSPPPSGDAAIDALIDAYLDGDMTPEQHLEFDEQVRANEALARELALQQRADESLRRQFQPPAVPALPSLPTRPALPIAGAAAPANGSRRRFLAPLAAAAILAIAATAYFTLGSMPVGQTYHNVVAAGFKPEWVCENDEQFHQYTKDRFGAPWRFDADPSIKLVGWRYSQKVLSPDESVLLATKDNQKIVVVVDQASNDHRLRASEGVHLYRRTMGNLVLYELSPLEKPEVIGRIALDEPGTK
jgi:hypothetical protein